MFILKDDILVRIRKFFRQDFFFGSREKLSLYLRKEGSYVLLSVVSVEKRLHIEFSFKAKHAKVIPTVITISRRIFYREVTEIVCSSVGTSIKTVSGDYQLEYNHLSLQGIKNFTKYTYSEQDILNNK